jgi:broad specificity phosphatase PhoE
MNSGIARFLPLLVFALMICSAAAEPAVFLVRHAEKADAGSGDPKDPELSETGLQRAERLAQMLKDVRLTAVFASEYKRTQATANAVAKVAGVEPTIVPAKETTQLIEKTKSATGNVLIVGHSNTLPDILKALGAPEEITIDEADYDNLFIWNPATKQLLRLHFR